MNNTEGVNVTISPSQIEFGFRDGANRGRWHSRSIFDVKLLNAMFDDDARKWLVLSRLPQ